MTESENAELTKEGTRRHFWVKREVGVTYFIEATPLGTTEVTSFFFRTLKKSLNGVSQVAISGKEPIYQYRRPKRHGLDPWVGKIPLRRAWQPTPVFLPREFHRQGRLVGYSAKVAKSRTQL